MSFNEYKEFVDINDTVILFLGYENMLQTKVVKDKVHQTKYGALYHNDLIGKRYGTKIECTKGWLYILHPSPELWTLTLPHRTQILYATDISMITMQLDLKPGSIVVESGTGSASLSHALLRSIAPNGHLHTFDFHEKRVEQAKIEFTDHGFENIVTVKHRDVCNNGFDLHHVADAVFLDLPTPWDVVQSAKSALKREGGRICSFSPCIEQVQRTCEKLHDHGFTEVTTLECIQRVFDVRTNKAPIIDLGYGPGRWCSTGAEPDDKGNSKDHPAVGQLDVSESPETNPNIEIECDDKSLAEEAYDKRGRYSHKKAPVTSNKLLSKTNGNAKSGSFIFKSGQPPINMPGHTGYLTFATLYPTL